MNILLIGMPGSGKSSFGKSAAKCLSLDFVDMDKEIVRRENRTINEIFDTDGEDYFRRIESEVLCDCLKMNNAVISTGGGIVKSYSNIEAAKSAGAYIIFIDRPIELIIGDIDTSGRPLLKDGAEKLKKLYAERYERYRSAADAVIKNDKGYKAVLDEITVMIKEKVLD